MTLTDDLYLERNGQILTLRCNHTHYLFGVAWTAISLFWIYGWCTQPNVNMGILFWVGLLPVALIFVPVGIYLCLPWEVKTTFDLRTKRMVHRQSFCNGLYERLQTHSFAEVEGVGIKEYNSEGFSYTPIAKLKNGNTFALSTSGGGYLLYADTIQLVSNATGLPVLRLPSIK